MNTRKVSNCYRQRFADKARQFNKRGRPLVAYLKKYADERSIILDVGSGPFTTIGTGGNIVACDILADEYRAMMKEREIVPIVPVQKQNMESLTYDDNSFDLVHCRNALDHTENIEAALKEMARVCKPWGRIHLRHYPNVAEKNNYNGSHYWNLCVFEGDCKIWKKDQELLLSDILPDAATYLDNRMVVSNWMK